MGVLSPGKQGIWPRHLREREMGANPPPQS